MTDHSTTPKFETLPQEWQYILRLAVVVIKEHGAYMARRLRIDPGLYGEPKTNAEVVPMFLGEMVINEIRDMGYPE